MYRNFSFSSGEAALHKIAERFYNLSYDDLSRATLCRSTYSTIHPAFPTIFSRLRTIPLRARYGDNVRYLHSDITTMERVEIIIQDIESEMKEAVQALAFERAAELRDQIKELRALDLDLR